MTTHKEVWHVVTWHEGGEEKRAEFVTFMAAKDLVESLHEKGKLMVKMHTEERRCL